MMTKRTSSAATLAVCVTIATTLGCAQVPKASTAQNAPQENAQQKRELVKQYEQRRDEIQYLAAVSKAQQGDTGGAQELLELLLERSPDHRAATLLASEIAFELDDTDQALRFAEVLVRRDANDAAAHHVLGLALESMGRLADAKQHFYEAAKLAPDNEIYRASVELIEESESLASATRSSTNDLRASGDTNHSDSSTTNNAGKNMAAGHRASANDDPVGAARHYRAAMAQHPQNPNIPRDAALQLLRHNQTATAVDLLSHACRQFPRSVPLFRALGTAHYRQAEYDRAQVALQQALSLDNADALTYFLLGAVREKLGDQQGSAQFIARAQQLDASLSGRR